MENIPEDFIWNDACDSITKIDENHYECRTNYSYDHNQLHKIFEVNNEGFYDGLYQEYYPNGFPKLIHQYKNHKRDGEQFDYNEKGRISKCYIMKNGELFDPNEPYIIKNEEYTDSNIVYKVCETDQGIPVLVTFLVPENGMLNYIKTLKIEDKFGETYDAARSIKNKSMFFIKNEYTFCKNSDLY